MSFRFLGDLIFQPESSLKRSNSRHFITRIPSTLKQEREVVSEALMSDRWQRIDDDHRYLCKVLTHYDMKQRWLVVQSKGALMRVEKTISKRVLKEHEELRLTLH